MDVLNSRITSFVKIPLPKRKGSLTSIDGSSKSLISDENSYENREFELEFVTMAKTEQERYNLEAQLFTLFDGFDYKPFRIYTDPNFTYFVKNIENVEVDRITRLSNARIYKYKLSAAAFKYFEIDKELTFSEPFELFSYFLFDAKPYFKITGNGAVKFQINDHTFDLNIDGFIELDSAEENQDAFKTKDDGSITFVNENTTIDEFPSLSRGVNKISWDGDVSQVIVRPRWRTI